MSCSGQQKNINGKLIHIKLHHLIGLLGMSGPDVCCHTRVRGFSWRAPSLASPDQLVAVKALHQSEVIIHNLKVGPPGASLPSLARHDDKTRYTFKNSVKVWFALFEIVCSVHKEGMGPLLLRLPPIAQLLLTIILHEFWE